MTSTQASKLEKSRKILALSGDSLCASDCPVSCAGPEQNLT